MGKRNRNSCDSRRPRECPRKRSTVTAAAAAVAGRVINLFKAFSCSALIIRKSLMTHEYNVRAHCTARDILLRRLVLMC